MFMFFYIFVFLPFIFCILFYYPEIKDIKYLPYIIDIISSLLFIKTTL
jgi:hypothetical protein